MKQDKISREAAVAKCFGAFEDYGVGEEIRQKCRNSLVGIFGFSLRAAIEIEGDAFDSFKYQTAKKNEN